MNEYDELLDEEAETSPDEAAMEIDPERVIAPSECSRWMFHRPGVYCYACGQLGGKTVKGVSLHLDLPPGGKAKSDFKKGKKK